MRRERSNSLVAASCHVLLQLEFFASCDDFCVGTIHHVAPAILSPVGLCPNQTNAGGKTASATLFGLRHLIAAACHARGVASCAALVARPVVLFVARHNVIASTTCPA